jgi:hypothetical protein
MGKPTLSTVGAYTFWGAHNDVIANDPALRGSWVRTSDLVDASHPFHGGELEREALAWKYGLEFIGRNPKRIPGLVAMKLWRLSSAFEDTPNRPVFWAFAAGWLLTAPWVIAGIILTFRTDKVVAAALLTPVLATVTAAMVFYGSVRFRDSVAPILIVFAARGLVPLVSRLCPAW